MRIFLNKFSRRTALCFALSLFAGSIFAAESAVSLRQRLLSGDGIDEQRVSREAAPGGQTRVSRVVGAPGRFPLIADGFSAGADGKPVRETYRAATADRLIVRARPDANDADVRAAFAAKGWTVRSTAKGGAYLVNVPANNIAGLEAAARGFAAENASIILRAGLNKLSFANEMPNDPSFSSLWGLHNTAQSGGKNDADIDAPEAWARARHATNVVVAVLDSGVDYTHPDLAANMWRDPDVADVPGSHANGLHGYDFVSYDGDPMDDYGHGTHCAGTIGAVGDNGVGIVGVCWSARIMAVKVLDQLGGGDDWGIWNGMQYAIDKGATVISCSFGGPGKDDDTELVIASNQSKALFVISAGNDGYSNDLHPQYPASYDYPNVISVAASDNSDNCADFSNVGAKSVHIHAPGVGIYSTLPGSAMYGSKNGTSMAAPHVSGAAALVWSAAPGASLSEIRAALLTGVDYPAGLAGLTTTGGRLNLDKAVKKFLPYVDVAPASRWAIASAGNFAAQVSANGSWSASSSAAWLSVSALSGATGETDVTVSFEANPLASDRFAEIVFTVDSANAATVTVSQVAADLAPSLKVSPTSKMVSQSAGSFTFAISANIAWSVSENADWFSASPDNGVGNGAVTVAFDANAGASRSAAITVSGAGAASQTLTLTQREDGYVAPSTDTNAPGMRLERAHPNAKFGTERGRTPFRVFGTPGYLFELDTKVNRIKVWNRNNSGAMVRTFAGSDTTNPSGLVMFTTPTGMAKHPSQNIFAVSDKGGKRVSIYSFAEGSTAAAFTFTHLGKIEGLEAQGATDVAISPDGELYVCGAIGVSGARYIRKFNGPYSNMRLDLEFNVPVGKAATYDGLDVDAATGNVFASSVSDHKVHEFTSSGAAVRSYGGASVGTGKGYLNGPSDSFVWRPAGIAPKLLVADRDNNRISMFNLNGSFYETLFKHGADDNSLSLPNSVWADARQIVIADTQNSRLQVYGGPDDDYLSNVDSDNDGIPDSVEDENGTDPTDPNSPPTGDPGDPDEPLPEGLPKIVFTAITETNATFKLPVEWRVIKYSVLATNELSVPSSSWPRWLEVDPASDGTIIPYPSALVAPYGDVKVDVSTVGDDVFVTYGIELFKDIEPRQFFRIKAEVPAP